MKLLSADEIGRLLRPGNPMSASTVRSILYRAGIREVRGYPADQVEDLLKSRSDLDNSRATRHTGSTRRGHGTWRTA